MALPSQSYTEIATTTLKALERQQRAEIIDNMMMVNPLLRELFGTGAKGDPSMISDAQIRRISDKIFDGGKGEKRRRPEGVKSPPSRPRDERVEWYSAPEIPYPRRDGDVVVIDGNAVLRKNVVTMLEVANGSYVPEGYVQASYQELWYKPLVAEPVVQPEPEALWPPKRELDL